MSSLFSQAIRPKPFWLKFFLRSISAALLSLVPSIMARCQRCTWRHLVLPLHPSQPQEETFHDDPDLSPSSSIHEDSEYKIPVRSLVIACWHSDIPPVWVDIMNSQHFYSPAITDCHGTCWLKFEVRSESFRVPKKRGCSTSPWTTRRTVHVGRA